MAEKPESVDIVPVTDEKKIIAEYAGYLGESSVHDTTPIQPPMLRWRHQGASSLERTGGKFYNSLEGNDHPYDEVEAVFINGKNSRTYYASDYDARKVKAEGASPPDCKSNDGVYGQGMYGPGSEGNPSGKCDACPMSKWSGQGRDATPPPCTLSYDRLIYDFHTHQIGVVSFSRSKVQAIRDFQRSLQARNGGTVPMWGYKTRIYSEPKENYHVPKIEILGVLHPEEGKKFRALKQESEEAFMRQAQATEEALAEEEVSEADATAAARSY